MPALFIGPGSSTSNLVALFLVDSTTRRGKPSLAFASGEVLVARDVGAFANRAGVVSEVGGAGAGRGAYFYALSSDDVLASLVTIAVAKAGVDTFVFATAYPFEADFGLLEPDETRRRSTIAITDATTGAGVPDLTIADVDLWISLGGGAFNAAAGTLTELESGPDGYYVYTRTDAECGTAGLTMLLVDDVSYSPYMVAQYISSVPSTPVAPDPVPVPAPDEGSKAFDRVELALSRLPDQFKQRSA